MKKYLNSLEEIAKTLKEGYRKFITAQVSNPPKLAPVSDKQLEEIVKGE